MLATLCPILTNLICIAQERRNWPPNRYTEIHYRADAYPVGSATHNILWVGRGYRAVRPGGDRNAATSARRRSRRAKPATGTPRGDGGGPPRTRSGPAPCPVCGKPGRTAARTPEGPDTTSRAS